VRPGGATTPLPLPAGWLRVDVGGGAVLFGSRSGGVSRPPFASANAGYLTGDDPDHVAENRRRLGAALGGPAFDLGSWTRLRQVHGATVVGHPAARASCWRVIDNPIRADAAVTLDDDVTLAIVTADCGPVALAGDVAVGVAHAGWQGIAAGVLGATVRQMHDAEARAHIRAVVGPMARACCYEFGLAERQQFVARFGPSVATTTRDGRPSLDLVAAIRAALAAEGVDEVLDSGVCTICSPLYFSHRRDGGAGPTGRQATLVVRR